MLTRRNAAVALLSLAAAPLAWPAAAQTKLSADDEALVAKAAAYLQGLIEAKGRFTQTDSRGQTTQGTFFLKRPGKARFEYAAPASMVVVADGSSVTVADNRLKTFSVYPLGSTPLSIFLARTVRLDRTQVARVDRIDGGFVVNARDKRGVLALTFRDAPMQLAGWAVTDPQGRTTRVRLTDLQKTSGLSQSLFTPRDPRGRL